MFKIIFVTHTSTKVVQVLET